MTFEHIFLAVIARRTPKPEVPEITGKLEQRGLSTELTHLISGCCSHARILTGRGGASITRSGGPGYSERPVQRLQRKRRQSIR